MAVRTQLVGAQGVDDDQDDVRGRRDAGWRGRGSCVRASVRRPAPARSARGGGRERGARRMPQTRGTGRPASPGPTDQQDEPEEPARRRSRARPTRRCHGGRSRRVRRWVRGAPEGPASPLRSRRAPPECRRSRRPSRETPSAPRAGAPPPVASTSRMIRVPLFLDHLDTRVSPYPDHGAQRSDARCARSPGFAARGRYSSSAVTDWRPSRMDSGARIAGRRATMAAGSGRVGVEHGHGIPHTDPPDGQLGERSPPGSPSGSATGRRHTPRSARRAGRADRACATGTETAAGGGTSPRSPC